MALGRRNTIHYPQIQNWPNLPTEARVYFCITEGRGLIGKQMVMWEKNVKLPRR